MAGSEIKKELLRHVAKVEEEYSLQALNSLRCGGVADYYVEATSAVDVAAAVKAAIDLKLPYCVIGSGSRVLFSDGGYPGLVIRNCAASYGLSRDASQIVVDAGMPLDRLITLVSGQGLGGLTPFFGEAGTVGGAIYSDLRRGGFSFLSQLRYFTAIVPPARIDKEPTINRYKREWLVSEGGKTRLRELKDEQDRETPQPVLLTAMFQLTSVRPDELRERLQAGKRRRVAGSLAFGPIFAEEPGVPLLEMLKEVRAHQFKVGNLTVDRSLPLYLRAKGTVRSAEVRELVSQLSEAIERRYGVRPTERFEYLGVW